MNFDEIKAAVLKGRVVPRRLCGVCGEQISYGIRRGGVALGLQQGVHPVHLLDDLPGLELLREHRQHHLYGGRRPGRTSSDRPGRRSGRLRRWVLLRGRWGRRDQRQ